MSERAGAPIRRGDEGATVVQYGAVLILVAALVAVLFTIGIPTTVGTEARNAICQIFTGSECGEDDPGATPRRLPTLSDCVTQQVLDQQQSGVKIIAFGHEEQRSTQVQTTGEGGINVTSSNKTGDGVDIAGGLGFSAGPLKLGISVGGGILWTGQNQDRFQYEDVDQAEEHQQRVTDAFEDYIDEHGFPWGDDDGMAQLKNIPFDIAEDMGIPYTIINADGTDAFVEVNGSAGVEQGNGTIGLNGGLNYRESKLLGTSESVDEHGNTVYGDYHAVSQTLAGDIGLGAYWKGVGPRAVRDFSNTNGNVMHVQYDEDGNPMKVTMTSTTEWHTGEGGTVQVQFKLGGQNGQNTSQAGGGAKPSNSAGGSPTFRVRDGDVTVTTTTIDIPQNQRAAVKDELHTFFDGDFNDVLREGIPTIAQLSQGSGSTTTVQTYDSQQSENTDGIPINVTVGLEWVDINGSSRHQEMRLRDASIVDPVTGEQRPWVVCENAGGN